MQLNYKNASFFIYYIFVLIRVDAATMLKQGSEKESARNFRTSNKLRSQPRVLLDWQKMTQWIPN